MEKTYSRPSTCRSHVLLESGFLAGSYVNVDADVKVETFKDGFAELGDDGFTVDFV